ncbi:hypothetical protein QYE76_041606 [Lolium multiflorum]|uniref:Retrotransposon gag domain-containing protein n=1 Tax=Lolium multiflorum TaxID=4521 RepID=A0AAD8TF34_LOLMU|nr:hypothetical protein QYE76_041606 [Lolium multiflorum]
MFPSPRINEVLPPVASAVATSTTVAPTVGHGTSSLRATARPYSPVRRPVASGRMIATGNFFHIQPSTYRPASSPLKHAWMVPIGSINLFVGLAGVSDPSETRPSRSHDPFAPGQLLTATRPVTGEVYAEAEAALEDDAESAVVAPVTNSNTASAAADSTDTAPTADSIDTIPVIDSVIAAIDADFTDIIAITSVAGSTAASPTARSIATASTKDSISMVSHPSDFEGGFEDDSILSLFGSDSDSDSVEAPRYRYPTAVFMAGGEEEHPVDAFTTPLPATATATEIEAHRAALEEQRKKELAERQKFRLEQDEVRAVSHYRQQRNRRRMERARANDFPSARLNFDDPDGEIRVARVQNPDIPEGSRAAADRAARGAPPPPPPPPPPEVPRAEVDANGLPLHSSPADNVAAAQAVLARIPETGDGAILVQHAKALVAKALEQQHAAADSQGRLYSRTSASRAASSDAANRAIVNANNGPPPAPRAAHSSNNRVEPRPARVMVAANGQPVDARTHIVNDQEWRARNRLNDRHADEAPRQSAFTRIGPACFGPMIRGEPYPVGFKGPRDIEKYDTHIDPTVWIDSYAMAMGIQGHSELLAARYLPLMMDGVNRHWFNTLTVNSIDSWEEARAAFIQHFASAYTRATTIEDLDRCVQGPRESTRRWVQRWQDMWTTSSGISTDTAIYCFRRCCRYEPLSAKLRRVSRDNISISELFDIATRYADEDPTVDSDDEYGQRRNRRPAHTEPRRGDYRFAGRSNNGKRRGEGGHNELVATTDYEQREPKSFRRDTRAPREDRPQPKRFDARSLLDAPCIYHSKEGKPANHTTGNCYSLKQIERARRAKENDGGNQHKDRAKDQDQHKGEGFGRSAGSLHTFTGVGDRRDRKVLARAVAVHAVILSDVPRWLNWSEQSITWSREDHAPRIEYPGRVALVVRPKVADYWLPKTLMDGGSSINIMYYETFQRLGLPDSRLENTKVTFHGIVPGRKAFPIGKVTLPVTFGTPVNYRTERITFEVVNFRSSYHCVLGRQAFARFMATPHYAYNMMKMPGPRGVITVHGDPEMALECEDDSAKLADAVIADEQDNSAELAKYPVDRNDPAILEKPTELDSSATTFKAAAGTRQVDLVENDPSRQVTIGTGLSAQ